MDKDKVKSVAKVSGGKTVGEPKTTTKATETDSGNMIVEVTTVFEVENPEEVFDIKGSGITMSLETSN